jgi:prevent-host-death family protein
VPIESNKGHAMQSMSAKDAKYGFGRLIDLARTEPVTVEKHGRPVVVVMAVEEYERLSGKIEKQRSGSAPGKGAKT